jgi:hypothetical protein
MAFFKISQVVVKSVIIEADDFDAAHDFEVNMGVDDFFDEEWEDAVITEITEEQALDGSASIITA